MQQINFGRITLGTALILSIPLVAMQFTSEVDWGLFDFIFIGILLFGTGLVYELVAGSSNNTIYKAAVGVAAITSLLLVWVNAAVGIIGPEDNPGNVLYLGVLAAEGIGALAVWFRAKAMAKVMLTTALVQALVPIVALIIWKLDLTSINASWELTRTFGANIVFVVLFAGAGMLFRQAGNTPVKTKK